MAPPPCTPPRAEILCHLRIGLGRRAADRRNPAGSGWLTDDWGAIALNDNSLSRIPFRVRDELMIASMARWMRFVAIIKVVSGLVMAFFILVGIIYFSAVLGTGSGATSPSVTVTVNGAKTQMTPEKLHPSFPLTRSPSLRSASSA